MSDTHSAMQVCRQGDVWVGHCACGADWTTPSRFRVLDLCIDHQDDDPDDEEEPVSDEKVAYTVAEVERALEFERHAHNVTAKRLREALRALKQMQSDALDYMVVAARTIGSHSSLLAAVYHPKAADASVENVSRLAGSIPLDGEAPSKKFIDRGEPDA
jgi:hypothetical protein